MLAPAPAEPQLNHLQSRKDEFDLDDDPEAAAEAAERGDEGAAAGGKFAWSNNDREYTYDELLGEWGCCCCRAAAAELLLQSCCCRAAAAELLLQSCCCRAAAAELLLQSCCCCML
jgi:hypothetical protein